MPLCINEGLAALPIYCFGKFLHPHIEKLYKSVFANLIGLACLIVYLSCDGLHYLIGGIGLGGGYSPNYLVALTAILFIFIPILTVCRWLTSCRWLASVGRHSLGIMLTHCMMLHTVAVTLNRLFVKGSTLWIVLFLVAFVVVCFASYWLTIAIERWCPTLLGKFPQRKNDRNQK